VLTVWRTRPSKEESFLKLHTIVSDLDGTLLTAEHRLSDYTQAVLRRAQGLGIRVILASGRSAASVRPYVRQLGNLHPYIASNGGQVLSPDGQVLFEKPIALEAVRAVTRWLKDRGVYVQVYYGDRFFYDQPCAYAENYKRSSGLEGCQVPDLLAFIQKPKVKLLGVAEPERIPSLMREVNARFGAGIFAGTSEPEFLELSHPDAGKGPALAALSERLGFDAAGTLAAGDSLNDLSMIEWAGMGVAVDNARPEVKARAWRVAGHGPSGGVARLVEQLLAEGYGP